LSQQVLAPTLAGQPSLDLYGRLVFTRRFLEKVDTLYRQGKVHGPAHLGLGQEAIAVGTGSVLRPSDNSIGT
jgi:TPP-dependent pyruvate/acetoin dehydrogenase alpha subunit